MVGWFLMILTAKVSFAIEWVWLVGWWVGWLVGWLGFLSVG